MSTLRTLRTVAERRSFTAAAQVLGYTQSAVSRQIAAAEREIGTTLFERLHDGVRLTSDGATVLIHVNAALDALEGLEGDLAQRERTLRQVRVGALAAAGVWLLPHALAYLRQTDTDVEVSTRDGTTPALIRALRAGTLDFAVVSSRPPFRAFDQETPELIGHVLLAQELALAVPAGGRLAGRLEIGAEEAATEPWIASPARADEPQLGVWPGLPGRPRVRHWARDWTTKLALVDAGAGLTTIPTDLMPKLPPGVQVSRIHGVPKEVRLLSLVHLPDEDPGTVSAMLGGFGAAARELSTASSSRSEA